LLPRCGRYATVGGYKPLLGCARLEAMANTEIARLDRTSGRKATHDRRPWADVGYRVWNPFEAELRVDAGGGHDEVVKVFTRVIDVFER
jgi:hypothetical protein